MSRRIEEAAATEEEMLLHAAGMLERYREGGDLYRRALAAADHKLLLLRQDGRRTGWCTHCGQVIDIEQQEDVNAMKCSDVSWENLKMAGHRAALAAYPISPLPYEWMIKAENSFDRIRMTDIDPAPGKWTMSPDVYELPSRSHYRPGTLTFCPRCHLPVYVANFGQTGVRGNCYTMMRGMLNVYYRTKPTVCFSWGRSSVDPENTFVCVGAAANVIWHHIHDVLRIFPPEAGRYLQVVPAVISVVSRGKRGTRWERLTGYPSSDRNWRERWTKMCRISDGLPSTYSAALDVGSTVDTFTGRDAWIRDLKISSYESHRGAMYEIDRAMRFPAIEMMKKRGWHTLASRAAGESSGLKLTAKSIPQLLGISPERYQQIRAEKIADPSTTDLWAIRNADEFAPGNRFSVSDAIRLGRIVESGKWMKDRIPKGTDRERLGRYMLKNSLTIRDWTDHVDMLKKLHMDLTDRNLYPAHFQAEHEKLAGRCIDLDNAKLDKDICVLCKTWDKLYTWNNGDLIMVPHHSVRSLVEEGTVQHICIGSYGKRYAAGNTVLCTLRDAAAPDTPLFDVEIRPYTTTIVQCRGSHNDIGTNKDGSRRTEWRKSQQPRLDAFFEGWRKAMEQQIRAAGRKRTTKTA